MPIQMTPEEQSIQRRRAIAEAMMQRGLQPLESIGMAGGAPIPISHAQGLEKLASGYLGQQDVKAADAQLSALEQQKKAEKEAAIQKVLASMQNQPAIPAPADELGGGPGRPEMRKTPQELVQAALVASASPHPEVQNIGSTMWKFREAEQAREVTNAAKGTQLDKLITKRDELARVNPNDPNIEIYNNAIRKESETAKQINPTVVMPSPVTTIRVVEDNPKSKYFGKPVLKDGRTGRTLGLDSGLDVGAQSNKASALEMGKEKGKRAINMAGLDDVVKTARDLLSGATGKALPTGSGIGTAYDYAAGLFGMSPEGAEEAQTLKAVGAALTAKMPRMEGPQSDKDVQLYKEAAAVVGDNMIPRERRLAALTVVEQLYEKYADFNSGVQSPSSGGNANVDALLEKYK